MSFDFIKLRLIERRLRRHSHSSGSNASASASASRSASNMSVNTTHEPQQNRRQQPEQAEPPPRTQNRSPSPTPTQQRTERYLRRRIQGESTDNMSANAPPELQRTVRRLARQLHEAEARELAREEAYVAGTRTEPDGFEHAQLYHARHNPELGRSSVSNEPRSMWIGDRATTHTENEHPSNPPSAQPPSSKSLIQRIHSEDPTLTKDDIDSIFQATKDHLSSTADGLFFKHFLLATFLQPNQSRRDAFLDPSTLVPRYVAQYNNQRAKCDAFERLYDDARESFEKFEAYLDELDRDVSGCKTLLVEYEGMMKAIMEGLRVEMARLEYNPQADMKGLEQRMKIRAHFEGIDRGLIRGFCKEFDGASRDGGSEVVGQRRLGGSGGESRGGPRGGPRSESRVDREKRMEAGRREIRRALQEPTMPRSSGWELNARRKRMPMK